FYHSTDTPILTSFPTRRSSDLLLLIVWQISRMALLSWADLSYVLPMTSMGYVVVALIGKVLLHEEITTGRWAGIVLIVAGVALVDRKSTRLNSSHLGISYAVFC